MLFVDIPICNCCNYCNVLQSLQNHLEPYIILALFSEHVANKLKVEVALSLNSLFEYYVAE